MAIANLEPQQRIGRLFLTELPSPVETLGPVDAGPSQTAGGGRAEREKARELRTR